MSLPDIYSYHFYPVGQGLFSTGAIRRHDESCPRFLWVYDCGTSSSKRLVKRGIQRLKHFTNGRDRIDLLVLSHFDHDHISGVVDLLKEFQIGTLILPYMHLAKRLLIAFEEGSGEADDPVTEFFINPVDFLLTQEGLGIERILFVTPSGNEGPPYPVDGFGPREPGPEDPPKLDFDTEKPDDQDEVASMMQAAGRHGASVDFLRPGSSIKLASAFWEFIPYNDDPEEEISETFMSEVAESRDELLSAMNPPARKNALKHLKKVFDIHFGSDYKERNVISLFLYSGPVYSIWNLCRPTLATSRSWPNSIRWDQWPLPFVRDWLLEHELSSESRARCSILYSGDGYLDTDERLEKLINYLEERRVRRVGVFQVMHHGAETNWHQGVARTICPLFSVFSSDPERRKWKHPHAPVLRDFWNFGPVQVDKNTDFNSAGYLNR